MRRVAITLGLALSLLGCGSPGPTPAPTRGAQVPLLIEEDESYDTFPSFVNVVIDVVADPRTGAPLVDFHGVPMRWPKGYTAWRFGSETEVLDPAGNRALVTGRRYRFYPGYSPHPYHIVAAIEACPPGSDGPTCVLGVHQQGDF